MTNEEIKSKVADYRKKAENKSMPESARKKFTEMADKLEKDLKEEKAEPKAAEKKTEVKDKDKVPAKKAPAKAPAKKAPAPAKKEAPSKKGAKKPAKKVAPAKATGEKKPFTYEGKEVSQETVKYCLGLVEEWRKKRAAKAEKKSTPAKKESVSEKVGKNVGAAVKQAVESIPDKAVIKAPEKVVTKIERLADAAEEFIAAFKEVLGEKFDKAKIEKEMKPIYILIEDIKEKYL